MMDKFTENIAGQKLLIIGLGLSGRAAARFLLCSGAVVCAADQRWQQLEQDSAIKELLGLGLQLSSPDSYSDISHFDAVIVSPGVPPTDRLYQSALQANVAVIGEAELALRHISSPCIGVTGTNGKTTVTLMIAHVLQACGIPSKPVGNIGVPLTELLEQSKLGTPKSRDDAVLVVELSSFQLETLSSQCLDCAVLLNVTPDHLDRHGNLEGCARTKARIFNCVKPIGCRYISQSCDNNWSWLRQEWPLQIYDSAAASLDMPLERRGHDRSNALAAYAACSHFGVSAKQFLAALMTFIKPPHRLQWVTTIGGVDFYDDSKATNIDAVLRAVDSLRGRIILIAGGVDKGSSYLPWVEGFDGKVRQIYAIGKAAPKIVEELSPAIPVQYCTSLEDAVASAVKISISGDIVLLSPGCASYDMFTDYAHRGREFQRIVKG